MKWYKKLSLLICLMMNMLSFSLIGQNDSLSIVPTKSIIQANQTYVALSHKVTGLEGNLANKEKQIENLVLSYNYRLEELAQYKSANIDLRLLRKEQQGIIKQQEIIIKVVGTIAVTAIGYATYKTFKRQTNSVYYDPYGAYSPANGGFKIRY